MWLIYSCFVCGACSGTVGWGTALQARRLCVQFPMALEFFHWHNSSSCTLALGSTQPLTEMSMGGVVVGNGSWCIGLTTSPASCAEFFIILELESPGTLLAYNRPLQGLLYLYFVFWVSKIKTTDALSLSLGNRFKYKLCFVVAWISLTLWGI